MHDGLVLGYANLAEPAIEEGIRRLARALEELPGRGPRKPPTNLRTPRPRMGACLRDLPAGPVVHERWWRDREVVLEIQPRWRFSRARTRGDGATRRHAAERTLGSKQPAIFALVAIRERAVALERLRRASGDLRAPRAARVRTARPK